VQLLKTNDNAEDKFPQYPSLQLYIQPNYRTQYYRLVIELPKEVSSKLNEDIENILKDWPNHAFALHNKTQLHIPLVNNISITSNSDSSIIEQVHSKVTLVLNEHKQQFETGMVKRDFYAVRIVKLVIMKNGIHALYSASDKSTSELFTSLQKTFSEAQDTPIDVIPLAYFSNPVDASEDTILEKLKALNCDSNCYDYNFTLPFQKISFVKSDNIGDSYNVLANDIVVAPFA